MFGDLTPVTPVRSSALEKSLIASEVACVLMRAVVTNTSAGTLYLHVFDARALPNAGAVPITPAIPVSAGTSNGDDWRPQGLRMLNGVVLALSSTLDTLTLVGSDVGRFFVEKV
jgi:hypothetical protein